MSESRFQTSRAQLSGLIEHILELARNAGATDAEAEASEACGQSVTVRQAEVETIEYTRDKGIGITVYVGQRRGHANTSDFSREALAATVNKAMAIARQTGEDPAAGLPDAEWLATGPQPDLDLFHPWAIDTDEAIDLARRMEAAAFAVDARIDNSDGASFHTQDSQFVLGNSRGFLNGYATSRHSLSCAVIAEDESGMQRDYWFDTSRVPAQLQTPEWIGQRAGERTVRRLSPCRVPTGKFPVLFEAPIATSLISHLVGALSGSSLYRKSSFLLDSLGEQLFPEFIQLSEDPFVPRGLASSPFDNEGVKVQARQVVERGILQGYFLSTYSGRKLGLPSTGNAGGNHNLKLSSTGESFAALLQRMGTGLVVTELMGQGVNLVTGDYSRGAAGFWVENGQIVGPVEEITVAGHLRDMFRQIVAVGADELCLGSKTSGSILVDGMTVAGE